MGEGDRDNYDNYEYLYFIMWRELARILIWNWGWGWVVCWELHGVQLSIFCILYHLLVQAASEVGGYFPGLSRSRLSFKNQLLRVC